MRRAFLGLLLGFLLCPAPVRAVSVHSDVGLTPYQGQTILRQQLRYTRKTDDPTDQDRKTEVLTLPLTAVYGITEFAAVVASMPYLAKTLESGRGADRTRRGDSGVGDLTVLGKLRVHTKDFPGATSRLALLGGVKLPTGDAHDADSSGELPRTLQLGSGSTDAIAAIAYTWQSLDNEWDLNAGYQFNTAADGFEFGDKLQYTLAYQHRVLPRQLPQRGVYTQLNIAIEANGVWNRRNYSRGARVDDSGGHTLFLSPGLQVASQHLIAEASIQLPAVQDLSGNQVKTDFVLVGSVRITF